MNPLPLTPLPSLRANEAAGTSGMERDGLVDESVVLALVADTASSRPYPCRSQLALAPNNMDFAGWSLPHSPPVPPSSTLPALTEVRRAAPPTPAEPGLGEPHHGRHRWWLAGLAGALSTLLFSVLLISLTDRLAPRSAPFPAFRVSATPHAEPASKPEVRKLVPELTDASLVP